MAHRAAHDRRVPARRPHQGRDRQPAALKRRARAAALAAAAALAGACVGVFGSGGPIDAWARAQPELAGRDVGRLGDATPYVVAADGALVFFWCRWPLDAPLRVALPPDAGPADRALLEHALRAWEAAVPGLRFETAGEGERTPLRLRFRERGPEGARAAAECRVEWPIAAGPRIAARLVRAEVWLRRGERDAWGRPVPLTDAERLGSAVHELGHALGLQGHARRGRSAMVPDAAAVRRVGRGLLAGDPLHEPALAALYALPSGRVVARRALGRGSTAEPDRLGAAARRLGAAALEVRVGDRAARIGWEGPGRKLAYYLREPSEVLAGTLDFERALEAF